ncbi:MAG: hypothetical protein JNM24_17160 [Bdellovibrionaceae bacterium]|nr:hypothetical protein [Pseudobdellovibrionaceae bacterium]
MNKTHLFLISVALIATFSSESFASNEACIQFYGNQTRAKFNTYKPQDPVELQKTKDYFSSLLNVDLLQYRSQEVNQVASGIKYKGAQNIIPNAAIDALIAKYGKRRWTTQQIIAELNEATFSMLDAYRPDDASDRRHDFLPSKELAERVLMSIEQHPVVSSYASNKYQQHGTEIGYCFGRGCYVDLMLMRLGIDRDSIKKIWAVGPMAAGGITWQFHIGHMVRLPDNTWVVIDNVPSYDQVYTARQWGEHFKQQNADGTLRFFITDSDKFTPSLGAYDPVQLGLNINRTRDWYKGYFQDLMSWFRDASDSEVAQFLGIPKIPARPEPMNPTPQQIAESRAEEAAFSSLPPYANRSGSQLAAQNSGKNSGRLGNMWNHIRNFGKRLGFDTEEQQQP